MVQEGGQKLTAGHLLLVLVLVLLKIVEGSGVEGLRAIAGLQDLACDQLVGDRKIHNCCCRNSSGGGGWVSAAPGGPTPVSPQRPMASNRLLALVRLGVAVRPDEGLSAVA